MKQKNDIIIVRQQFKDPDGSSNNVEVLVYLKETKHEPSEKAIEEVTVRCGAREKEENIVEHPGTPESELNYKNKNSEFSDSDLNSGHNDSDRTSIIQ